MTRLVPLALDYEDIERRAVPVSPFSNGYEGDTWTSGWCGTCVHDSEGVPRTELIGEPDVSCPLVVVALMGSTPQEWDERDRTGLLTRYVCRHYEPREGERDARKLMPPT